MKVIAVNLGERKQVSWKGKIIETGIFKYPVNKPIFLGTEDVVGDNVVDRKYHGGINKAVYAYGENHYAYWKELYPDLEWNHGMFGENLTITNFEETKITVGDTYQLGEAVIEVTEPREPCRVLGIRFNDMKIIKQFWNTTKSGIYFKVVKTGNVQVGDKMTLLKKAVGEPTIAEVFAGRKK